MSKIAMNEDEYAFDIVYRSCYGMKLENDMLFYDMVDTPIGTLYIVMDNRGLSKIEILESKWSKFLNFNSQIVLNKEKCKEVKNQIIEYFNGERKVFNIKLSLLGTPFRIKVWNELSLIPYGETRSYSELATNIGNNKAVRAVGQANKYNPIPIIIPCHRIIGKNGTFRGYAGDNIDIQEFLLKHEKLNK